MQEILAIEITILFKQMENNKRKNENRRIQKRDIYKHNKSHGFKTRQNKNEILLR